MKGGVTRNDRIMAAEVRRLGLKKLKDILEDENHQKYSQEFFAAVFLRLAANLLPRLNEHTGADGDKLFPAPLLNGKSNDSNNSTKETTLTEETN